MPTLHEKLIEKAGIGKKAAPTPTGYRKEPVILDDVGLDKLAQALETLARSKEDLDPEVVKALMEATSDIELAPKKG